MEHRHYQAHNEEHNSARVELPVELGAGAVYNLVAHLVHRYVVLERQSCCHVQRQQQDHMEHHTSLVRTQVFVAYSSDFAVQEDHCHDQHNRVRKTKR